MIVGFNHNIAYQGVGFHVQTEDSGLKSPSLVTLLYHGGIIVASQKTSYADMLDVENLNHVVEELAKEQHKGMLRRLTKGEFDGRISELGIEIGGVKAVPKSAPPASETLSPREKDKPLGDESPADPQFTDEVMDVGLPIVDLTRGAELPVASEPSFEPSRDENLAPRLDSGGGLDDLIYSYLTGGDEKG